MVRSTICTRTQNVKKRKKPAVLLWGCRHDRHMMTDSSDTVTDSIQIILERLHMGKIKKSLWIMLRNKAENKALEAWCHLCTRTEPGIGESNTSDLPTHSTPWPEKGTPGGTDIPACSDYTAIRADGKTLMWRISFTFSLVTFPRWCAQSNAESLLGVILAIMLQKAVLETLNLMLF